MSQSLSEEAQNRACPRAIELSQFNDLSMSVFVRRTQTPRPAASDTTECHRAALSLSVSRSVMLPDACAVSMSNYCVG